MSRERWRFWLQTLVAPALGIITSIGWLNAQIANLDRGDKDRDKLREIAVNARDRELTDLKTDVRELRAAQSHCN